MKMIYTTKFYLLLQLNNYSKYNCICRSILSTTGCVESFIQSSGLSELIYIINSLTKETVLSLWTLKPQWCFDSKVGTQWCFVEWVSERINDLNSSINNCAHVKPSKTFTKWSNMNHQCFVLIAVCFPLFIPGTVE